jgi:hypothetical protein
MPASFGKQAQRGVHLITGWEIRTAATLPSILAGQEVSLRLI